MSPAGPSNASYLHQITGLRNASHIVSIRRSGRGDGFIIGVEVGNTYGVPLYNGGLGGTKAARIGDAGLCASTAFASSANNTAARS